MIRAATALISAAVTLLAPAARAEPGWTWSRDTMV